MKRIQSNEQLLEYVVKKYYVYEKAFRAEPGALISKYYLTDFLQDLLLIQRFVSKGVGK